MRDNLEYVSESFIVWRFIGKVLVNLKEEINDFRLKSEFQRGEWSLANGTSSRPIRWLAKGPSLGPQRLGKGGDHSTPPTCPLGLAMARVGRGGACPLSQALALPPPSPSKVTLSHWLFFLFPTLSSKKYFGTIRPRQQSPV
jgi:hypothetical protein